YGHDLAAKVRERDLLAVLRGQRKLRRRRDLRQRLLLGDVRRCFARPRQHKSRSRHNRKGKRRPHRQPFISRLSWLKKRKSVPSARILLGVALMKPDSFSRSE